MQKLFEPIKINQLILKNRLIVPAMLTNYANLDGTLSEEYIAYHERKAQGGWGLIITEDYKISPYAGSSKHVPGIYTEQQISDNMELTRRVHEAGGKIAVQLFHAGRTGLSIVNGVKPVAPSSLKDPILPEIPKELSVSEIEEIENQFVLAALNAKKSGFDAIEIHGAHGYLINEFFSPFSNKRSDNYGGSIYNRARFSIEIIQKIRKAVGPNYPIIYRMSTQEYVQGGITIEDSKVLAMLLEKSGVDMLHCSQGIYRTDWAIIPPSNIPQAHFIKNTAAIKQVVSIPVAAVGRINDPDLAEEILLSKKADIISMGRASLADPDFPVKVKNKNYDEINRCIGCVQGCNGNSIKGLPVRCTVNPFIGRESFLANQKNDTMKKKNIIVVGGGISGCEAAILCSQKGHSVKLFEQSHTLGGQWKNASIPPYKTEFASFINWQRNQLLKYKVPIIYNKKITANEIMMEKADVVIIATGSNATLPKISGIDRENVYLADDILNGNYPVGKNVVIIGGGLVGAETADFLLSQNIDINISIIESTDTFMRDGENNPKKFLLKRLQQGNVKIYLETNVINIAEDSITIKEKDKTMLSTLPIDTIIIATGRRSEFSLRDQLTNYNGKVLLVGDASCVKNGYANIQEVFDILQKEI